jgi:chromosome segregation ATPase
VSELEGGGASRSTDPAAGTSSGTDVSLREYLIQAIENSRRECREGIAHIEQSIAASKRNADENLRTALTSIDRRFDNVNEFRDALGDLSQTMATKVDMKSLTDKVVAADEALEARFEALYQRNRDDIDRINKRLDLSQGELAGSRLTKGSLYALVAAVVGIIGLLVFLANYLTSRAMP